MKFSPAIKGLITAASMIALFLLLYQPQRDADSRLQYLVYGLYGAGIVWTLLVYRKSSSYNGKFMETFNQGFKCFVVVTLCMALFYGIFNFLHPEFAAEMATSYKDQLLKEKNHLPSEIEDAVATFKKQYTLKLVSGAIFGYLIIGTGITGVFSALFSLTKK